MVIVHRLFSWVDRHGNFARAVRANNALIIPIGRWVINSIVACPRNGLLRLAATIGLIAIRGYVWTAVLCPYLQAYYLVATSGFWSTKDTKSKVTIGLISGIAILSIGPLTIAADCQKLSSTSRRHTERNG